MALNKQHGTNAVKLMLFAMIMTYSLFAGSLNLVLNIAHACKSLAYFFVLQFSILFLPIWIKK